MIIKKIIVCMLLFSMAFLQEWDEKTLICGPKKERKSMCLENKQFLENYWVKSDYSTVIEIAYALILCECIDSDIKEEENTYLLYGQAYYNLGKPDSSTWAFKKGLKKNPNSEKLLDWAAQSSSKEVRNGNLEKLDEQLYFLERLLEINPENFSALERMSDAYKRNDMYDEQIVVIDQWLKLDPSNKKAISNKKVAFEKLGKDASEVDKERWNREPDNLEYGILYLKSLMSSEDYELASEVTGEILLYNDTDKRLLKLVSDIYIKNLDDNKAEKYLEKLMKQDDIDTDYLIKLSNVYLNLDKYNQAYAVANKAIVLGQKIGKSYFQRAIVLERLVDFYGSDELDFCDRLVYDLAFDDYDIAYKNGVLNARVYKNNLKELITSVGDWFLIGEKFTKMSPDNNECFNIKGSDCYSFIKNREVNKK